LLAWQPLQFSEEMSFKEAQLWTSLAWILEDSEIGSSMIWLYDMYRREIPSFTCQLFNSSTCLEFSARTSEG
jgi:hypothetical protein